MKSFIPLFISTVLFFSVLPLFSQSEAVISYAEGSEFQLVRNGQSASYDIMKDDVIGLTIQVGDQILTGENSFIEIQLNNGEGGVIKIAGNTTFSVTSLDGKGGGVFKMLFGRIRVKVAALTGDSRLWISGYDTVAGVRGTDFGYDLFYNIENKDGERETSVYCFDGAVDVVQFDKETISKKDLMDLEPFILEAGKMVTTKSSRPDAKLKPRSIDEEILSYWDVYPFMTVVGGAVSRDDKLEVSDDLNLNPDFDTVKGSYEIGGKILFATGIGVMTIGGLLKAFLPGNSTANDLSIGLLSIGGASVLAGGGMMIYSFSLP